MISSGVRLSANVQQSIQAALSRFFSQKGAKAYIFGSRADSAKKGGDIDILVVLPHVNEAENILETTLSFETYLQKLIGEQKIDTKIVSPEEFENPRDPFIKIIKKSAIMIWEN